MQAPQQVIRGMCSSFVACRMSYLIKLRFGSDDPARSKKKNEEAEAYVKAHSFSAILLKLQSGKVETKCFYSSDKSMVFVKLRCSLERLCRQASSPAMALVLPLDGRRIRDRFAEGQWDDIRQRYRWAPKAFSTKLLKKAGDERWAKQNYHRSPSSRNSFEYMTIRDKSRSAKRLKWEDRRILARIYPITDNQQQCSYKWWEHHHGRYTDRAAFDPSGSLYVRDTATNSPFRGVDRLKLIKAILESDIKEGGCELDMAKLLEHVSVGAGCHTCR